MQRTCPGRSRIDRKAPKRDTLFRFIVAARRGAAPSTVAARARVDLDLGVDGVPMRSVDDVRYDDEADVEELARAVEAGRRVARADET